MQGSCQREESQDILSCYPERSRGSPGFLNPWQRYNIFLAGQNFLYHKNTFQKCKKCFLSLHCDFVLHHCTIAPFAKVQFMVKIGLYYIYYNSNYNIYNIKFLLPFCVNNQKSKWCNGAMLQCRHSVLLSILNMHTLWTENVDAFPDVVDWGDWQRSAHVQSIYTKIISLFQGNLGKTASEKKLSIFNFQFSTNCTTFAPSFK